MEVFQSDDLEGEFGVYRGHSGSSYFVSVTQILASARLRQMKLFHFLSLDQPEHTRASCCEKEIDETELELLDTCLNVSSLGEHQRVVCYYVAGFLARRGGIQSDDAAETIEHFPSESEFLKMVSRGGLSLPPEWLYYFVCICFLFFSSSESRCLNFFSRVLVLISEFQLCDVDVSSIFLILEKTLSKGLMKRVSDSVASSSNNRKLLKFNN